MDASDYMPMFLAEGREHLQTLNLSLVEIEQNPRDTETMNAIFRVAHTLKGMSATMGFNRMASLTHEMENVMEGMRSRADGLAHDALDALFACLDTLERMVEEIEEGGTEASDPAELVGRLKSLLASGAAQEAVVEAAVAESEVVAVDGPVLDADLLADKTAAGLPVYRVTIRLVENCDMPSVRAYVAVRAAEEHGDIVQCEPTLEIIESGEVDATTITVWITTTDESDTIRDAVAVLDGIGSCEVTEESVAGA